MADRNHSAAAAASTDGTDEFTVPGFADIFTAGSVLRSHFEATPLVYSDALSHDLDADVYLKRDDVLPTGAFKIRGGLVLADHLAGNCEATTLVTASTGNHGQSIAYAGRELELAVEVVVPEDANTGKIDAMECLGARVLTHGASMDRAFSWAQRRAEAEDGSRFVHPANEPKLVAGVATAGLEVVEELPSVDTIVSPVGSGSYASGFCLTAGELVGADVIGVQTTGANAAYRAFHTDTMEPVDAVETSVEGMAVGTPFELTTRILGANLADFIELDDPAFERAVETLLEVEHVLAETAGVASVAGAYALRDRLEGRTVVLPVCGRNLALDKLADIL